MNRTHINRLARLEITMEELNEIEKRLKLLETSQKRWGKGVTLDSAEAELIAFVRSGIVTPPPKPEIKP